MNKVCLFFLMLLCISFSLSGKTGTTQIYARSFPYPFLGAGIGIEHSIKDNLYMQGGLDICNRHETALAYRHISPYLGFHFKIPDRNKFNVIIGFSVAILEKRESVMGKYSTLPAYGLGLGAEYYIGTRWNLRLGIELLGGTVISEGFFIAPLTYVGLGYRFK